MSIFMTIGGPSPMQNSSPQSPEQAPPVHVWINVAILTMMLGFHVLLIGSVLLNLGVFMSTKAGTFGTSSYESGRLVGNVVAIVFAGAFALVGIPWVPTNIYGIVTGKKWARQSLIVYWILCILSICCFPIAIYPLISLWRPSMKSWFCR